MSCFYNSPFSPFSPSSPSSPFSLPLLHSINLIEPTMKNQLFFLFGLLALLHFGCGEPAPVPGEVNEAFYNQLQEQLITAEPGTVIEIPEGTYEFDRSLSLDGISNITLKGAGMDKTQISFANQKVGAEGLRISADSITIQDMTVRDAKGDCIKIQDSKGVRLIRVRTTWSGGAQSTNGGYGLYPVSCTNVLIEGCEAFYASDAGIYVGQSRNVIVRNCLAKENVAGIEIENCIQAEVYNNRAEGNTGGILVFDLPDLPLVNGHSCKVYNNQIIGNNHKNFAPEGNIVGIVPPGTGIILLAAKNVEIYKNEILDHKTMGTAIASFQITQKPWNNEEYNPFSSDIFIHDNTYERKRGLPDLSKDFGKMVNLVFKGKPQDILYDGIIDESKGKGKNPMNLCIQQSTEDLRFANIDAANDFDNVVKDLSDYTCQGVSVAGVEF
jgi:parallel beta-helix repeat protein